MSAERSEKRDTSTTQMRGSKDAKVRPQRGGMAQKGVAPIAGKTEERRERREERDQHDSDERI